MMGDFGSDFSGFTDIDENWSFISGDFSAPKPNSATALTQALARRLTTPNGALWYDPNYGYDLRELVSSTRAPESVEARIEAECRKDRRVDDCNCSVVAIGAGAARVWTITINPQTTDGETFAFVLSVNSVSVTLLTTNNGPITLGA